MNRLLQHLLSIPSPSLHNICYPFSPLRHSLSRPLHPYLLAKEQGARGERTAMGRGGTTHQGTSRSQLPPPEAPPYPAPRHPCPSILSSTSRPLHPWSSASKLESKRSKGRANCTNAAPSDIHTPRNKPQPLHPTPPIHTRHTHETDLLLQAVGASPRLVPSRPRALPAGSGGQGRGQLQHARCQRHSRYQPTNALPVPAATPTHLVPRTHPYH